MKPIDFFNNAFTRKPSYWEDCSSVAVSRCPSEVCDWLATLPRHPLPDGYIPIRDFPAFTEPYEKVFVALVGKEQYLVNTEGFSYCRYAVRLAAV